MEGISQCTLTPRALEVLASCPARFALEHVRGLRRVGARRAADGDGRRVGLLNALAARLGGHDPLAALASWARRAEALAGDQESCADVLRHHARVHPPEDDRPWLAGVPLRRGHRGQDLWITRALPPRLAGHRLLLRVHVPILFAEGDGLTLVLPHVTSNADREEVIADRRRTLAALPIVWAVERWARQPVRTVLWDVVRNSPPRTPATVRCPSCEGSGARGGDEGSPLACAACAGTGVGGISRAACDTTYEVWQRTVARWPHLTMTREAERALDLVQRLRARGDTFAYRVAVHVRPGAVDRWSRELRALLRAAGVWLRADAWPRSPSACLGRSGPCPYRDNCADTAADPSAPYFIRTGGDPAWDEEIEVC